MNGRTRYNIARQCSLALLLLLSLSACGQKGPLYLPDDEQASAPAPNQNT